MAGCWGTPYMSYAMGAEGAGVDINGWDALSGVMLAIVWNHVLSTSRLFWCTMTTKERERGKKCAKKEKEEKKQKASILHGAKKKKETKGENAQGLGTIESAVTGQLLTHVSHAVQSSTRSCLNRATPSFISKSDSGHTWTQVSHPTHLSMSTTGSDEHTA